MDAGEEAGEEQAAGGGKPSAAGEEGTGQATGRKRKFVNVAKMRQAARENPPATFGNDDNSETQSHDMEVDERAELDDAAATKKGKPPAAKKGKPPAAKQGKPAAKKGEPPAGESEAAAGEKDALELEYRMTVRIRACMYVYVLL